MAERCPFPSFFAGGERRAIHRFDVAERMTSRNGGKRTPTLPSCNQCSSENAAMHRRITVVVRFSGDGEGWAVPLMEFERQQKCYGARNCLPEWREGRPRS